MIAARIAALLLLAPIVFVGPVLRAGEPDRWIEVHTTHFVVTSNAGEAQARFVSLEFERARALLERALPTVRFDPGPVVILAVDGQNSLRELLPQFWEQNGERPAGAYWAGPYRRCIALRADVPAREQFRLVLHEYVHLLTHTNVPDVPPWLDEGLSEFWEAADVRNDAVEIGGAALNHVKLLTSGRPWIPLDELLGLDKVPEARDKQRLSLFYAESWALVQYLMMGPNGHLTVAPAVDAAKRPELAPDLAQYIRGGRFAKRLLEIPRLTLESGDRAEDDVPARVLPPAQSLAVRAGCLADGQRPDAAKPLLAEALEANPNEPSVLETLGYVAFEQNRPAEAAGWFDRAIASGAASHLAYFYRAVLAGPVPARTGSTAPIHEDAYLKRAIELAPKFTPAYVRLADLYEREGRVLEEAPLRAFLRGLDRDNGSPRIGPEGAK